MSSPTDPGRPPLAFPAVLLLVVGALYATSAAEAVQLGDSGELTIAACLGGSAPSSSALHGWAGGVLCKLPWSTPAARVGALSFVAGLGAVLAVFAIVTGLGGRPVSALAAAVSLATGPAFWREASQPSLVPLQLFAALAGIWALAHALRKGTGTGWRGLAGLWLGLAIALHPSSLLLAPIALVSASSGLRGPGPIARAAFVTTCGLGLGLLPVLLGGGSFAAALAAWLAPADRGLGALGGYLSSATAHQSWLLLPFSLGGLVLLTARASGRPLGRGLEEVDRSLAALLLALPILAGPLRALILGDAGIAGERAWVLAHALLAIPLGLGLSALEARLRSGGDRSLARLAALCLLAVLAGAAIFWAYPRANLGARFHAEDWARNTLAALERGALLVGGTSGQRACLLYQQRLIGLRPDVQLVAPELLASAAYLEDRRRERPGFGRFVEPARGIDQTLRLIQAEHRRGVPVYLADASHPRVLAAFASYPVGPVIRLLPPGTPPPEAEQLFRENERLHRGFLRRGRPPDRERDPEAAAIAERYAAGWRLVATALYQEGDRQKALRALMRAQEHAPWLPIPDWFGPRRFRTR